MWKCSRTWCSNSDPVTDSEAEAMLNDIKAAPLLAGVRGQAGVDRGALTDLLQRLSRLLTDLPDIQELDLNPVLASADGARVVDARMTL
jgi:acyl-CoA synthetase (NDP forming)